MMIRRKPRQSTQPGSLPRQQSDFTAEGSPPPGQVAAAGTIEPKKSAGLPPAPIARKGPPSKSRWQR